MPDSAIATTPAKGLSHFGIYLSVLLPIAAAIILYQLEPLKPDSLPNHELPRLPMVAPRVNGKMFSGAELIGVAQLFGPEDIIYDHKEHVLYTGCADGWIKKIKLGKSGNEHTVEDVVRVSGRPLGLAFGHHDNIIVADADNGFLNVTKKGDFVEVLTKEADGLPFKLADGVDVAKDGMIYLTDASYKYSLKDFIWDVLEGKPHGRLMSFNPSNGETKVLVDKLYFGNGVAVSPDQNHVIYCETVMRRCRKYHIKGSKKGSVEEFANHLPGLPDNIHYDGDGHYWIALATAVTVPWDLALKYASIRKIAAIITRYIGQPKFEKNGGIFVKNGGIFVVDLEGKPKEHFYDVGLSLISTGIKIGNHVYCGSLIYPYIIKLDLTQYPAQAIAKT